MEFLKEILGDELYKQVGGKISGSDKKVKLVNAADGSYFPKEKFDQVYDQKKDLQAQVDSLKDISTKYETLQKDIGNWKDQAEQVPSLKKKMGEWETQAKDLEGKLSEANKQVEAFGTKEQEYQTQLKETQINAEIDKQLIQNNAKYPDLVSAKFDRTKIEIAENGTIKGIDDQLKNIKESYKELFGEEKFTGNSPDQGDGNPQPKGDTSKMTDAEYFAMKRKEKK